MNNLVYSRLLSENDADVSRLTQVLQLPEISRYLYISDRYFDYVTNTANVYFYKVYENNELIGAVHLEKPENVLYMDILIFPEYQGKGYATKVIKDIQSDIFNLDYERIEVSIAESNAASLKLFTSAGFKFVSKDDGLLDFIYTNK